MLILLFVMWKDKRKHSKNQAFLIQEILVLQKQINQLENLVNALPQNNQRDALKDVFAEIVPQEINVLSDLARQADELVAEIVRLEAIRRPAFKKSPPELFKDSPYWRKLSDWMREEKQWTCEKCGINLEKRRSDLHVHHIFGRGFNSPQHLKVLCIECHAEEPGHGFMKAHPEYQEFLKWRADR